MTLALALLRRHRHMTASSLQQLRRVSTSLAAGQGAEEAREWLKNMDRCTAFNDALHIAMATDRWGWWDWLPRLQLHLQPLPCTLPGSRGLRCPTGTLRRTRGRADGALSHNLKAKGWQAAQALVSCRQWRAGGRVGQQRPRFCTFLSL